MQFKVPQNIDMQDKIIGPLTLVQFFYLLFGGLIIYILFNNLMLRGQTLVFFVLAVPIGLFSFAMAFLKIQDVPFPSFFMALIKYSRTPRSRVWQHYNAPTPAPTKPKSVKKSEPIKKSFDTVKVSELSELLDSSREGDE
ncbi:PrgI family protein [Candidatus Berkelbacteria bacterium]|nr:PrgI family protein [Candidatus Berkelbacteria bacterium]